MVIFRFRAQPLQLFDSREPRYLAADIDRDGGPHILAAPPCLPPLQHDISAMQRAIERDVVARQPRHLARAAFEHRADLQILETPRAGVAPAVDQLRLDALHAPQPPGTHRDALDEMLLDRIGRLEVGAQLGMEGKEIGLALVEGNGLPRAQSMAQRVLRRPRLAEDAFGSGAFLRIPPVGGALCLLMR